MAFIVRNFPAAGETPVYLRRFMPGIRNHQFIWRKGVNNSVPAHPCHAARHAARGHDCSAVIGLSSGGAGEDRPLCRLAGDSCTQIVSTASALGISRFDLKYTVGALPHEKLMRSVDLLWQQGDSDGAGHPQLSGAWVGLRRVMGAARRKAPSRPHALRCWTLAQAYVHTGVSAFCPNPTVTYRYPRACCGAGP